MTLPQRLAPPYRPLPHVAKHCQTTPSRAAYALHFTAPAASALRGKRPINPRIFKGRYLPIERPDGVFRLEGYSSPGLLVPRQGCAPAAGRKNDRISVPAPTLDALVNRGIAVVLLAHATRREITTIDGITVEKSAPEIHADLANSLIEWSDFVGAARVGTSGRELVLTETNQLLAKNRYGINSELPLSWDAFMNAMVPMEQKTAEDTDTQKTPNTAEQTHG